MGFATALDQLSRLALQDTIASYCGSLFWASPEQLNGQSCSSATDIWSLGVILWEICTGEQPLRRVTRPLRSAVALMVAMPFAGEVQGQRGAENLA